MSNWIINWFNHWIIQELNATATSLFILKCFRWRSNNKQSNWLYWVYKTLRNSKLNFYCTFVGYMSNITQSLLVFTWHVSNGKFLICCKKVVQHKLVFKTIIVIFLLTYLQGCQLYCICQDVLYSEQQQKKLPFNLLKWQNNKLCFNNKILL